MKLLYTLVLIILVSSCSVLNLVKKRLAPPHPVKGGILFQVEAPSAKLVTLAGDFPDNLWGGTASSSHHYDPTIDKMYDDGTHGDKIAGDGIWSLIKKVPPGRYQYKFVIDKNTWITDPSALETVDDGYGGKNSVLIVK
jgi:1,4-alpha-glucan branching enzyme